MPWEVQIAMATTFEALYLGNRPIVDPTEGNDLAENAGSLGGLSFGGASDANGDTTQLATRAVTISPGTVNGGQGDVYDQNNNITNDTFVVNGTGPELIFDANVIYSGCTITYSDGSTANNVSLQIFQGANGDIYLVPSLTTATNDLLFSKPIRSITFGTATGATQRGLFFDRPADVFQPICFGEQTRILTPQGERPIQSLAVGDLVVTVDNGPKRIEWISSRHVDRATLAAHANARPVLIRSGTFGATRDVLLSPQHCVVRPDGHMVRAKHMAEYVRGVRFALGRQAITYFHLMFDSHQVVLADGVKAESYYPGPMGLRSLEAGAFAELDMLHPQMRDLRAGQIGPEAILGARARPVLSRSDLRAEMA
jgi:hypothetical protein